MTDSQQNTRPLPIRRAAAAIKRAEAETAAAIFLWGKLSGRQYARGCAQRATKDLVTAAMNVLRYLLEVP